MDDKELASLRMTMLTPGEALYVTRFSRDLAAAEKTAANMLAPGAKKPFPFQTVMVLGKRFVLRSEVLRLIGIEGGASQDLQVCSDNPVDVAPRVGRRRKGA